ncbi:DNA primase [Paenimyroides tangerinum]|uniref:DNA primase n=1 Tax=Paenimyroides tangerinum TaxID=2488728 RepID=A0A3P3W184_9FLAO|nr:DNA primase [Paenimyroides tangerinum]RRJ88108.1 DNA primase [Paenimyroides tangerinum]
MKRIIVDYAKLTNEILTMLVEKFPDGYDDADIIRFKNAKNEMIEAVEVRTEDTIYLVKVSTKLADRIVNFDDEEEEVVIPVDSINVKDIDLEADDDDEEEEKKDLPEFDDEDEDADKSSVEDFDDDEDEV